MRTRGFRGAAAATLALVPVLIAAPAAPAAPRAAERYDGKSATGQRIYLTVSADATRVSRYGFVVRTACTDGKRRAQVLTNARQTATTIDATGAFSHQSQLQRGFYPTSTGPVEGRFRTTFSGTFDAAGDSVSGTIESTFRSSRFNCSSGPVAFTMYRDGTAQAPFSDAVMTTGLYSASGKGVTARMRTLASGRVVLRADISYRAACRSGGNLRSGRVFSNYLLSDGGRRSIRGRARFRIRKDGVSVSIRFRLTLRFFESSGYRLAGSWNVRAKVSRGGRVIDTCRLQRSFKGTAASP